MSTRMSRSKAALVGAALVAGLLGVSACGSDSGSDGEATTASAGDDAAATSGAGDEAAATADVSDLPEVVAEVNGEPISREDFSAAYESQYQQAAMQEQMGGGPVDEEALRQQVLDGMIGNVLLTQEVEKQGIEVTDEDIDTLLAEYASGNGMEPQDFLDALAEQGMDEEFVRTELEKQVGTEKLLDQEAPVEEPTDEELKALYDEYAAQMGGATGEDGESGLPPFEEVKDQLKEQVKQEKQAEAANAYVDKLREAADITTNI
jgi:peptidyl-prolyl cis-trans isomerase SurA